MAVLPDGAASIWCAATRICTLDQNGFVDPGANTFTSTALVKATFTPTLETGDDIVVKNAAGDLGAFGKHGDIIKYYTIAIELATPDPDLEQVLAGGTVLTATGTALGTPTGLTVTGQTTLGTLAAGTYGYRVSQYNQYGESVATADVSTTTTGSTGTIVLSGVVQAAGSLGWRVYGRTIGGEQYMGSVPNIGTQATSAVSGTGTVTSLAVTALTSSIPIGTTFTIAGDTNTVKIVFTTTAFAAVNTVTLQVTASQSVTTTIAAGNIVPVFVDAGSIVPLGNLPATDTTAGPGHAGYQAPALGSVANTNGVSMEFFTKAYLTGYQTPTLPYYRTVFPRITGIHQQPRDVTNANMQSMFEGQAFQNPNWGTGPTGDWQFDSTKVWQRARCTGLIVPAAGYNTGIAATV
jgi:hypothetical protein